MTSASNIAEQKNNNGLNKVTKKVKTNAKGSAKKMVNVGVSGTLIDKYIEWEHSPEFDEFWA